MSEYSESLNTELYKYAKPIYITNPIDEDRTFLPISLNLNASNFNFDLARSDGLDIRVAEAQNGTGVFYMWISYWDSVEAVATVWFKLPYLLASETREVWLLWGNEGDGGISDIDSLAGTDPVFLFADGFDDDLLDSSKWPGISGDYYIDDSSLYLDTGTNITSVNCLLQGGVSNFILEMGALGVGSPTSTTSYAHRTQCIATENSLDISYFWEGSTDRQHNFEDGTTQTYNGTNRGLIIGSYNQFYIAYYEDTDRVYQGTVNRGDAAYNYEDSWERQVHRNTEPDNFKLWGPASAAAYGVAIDWIVAREYNPDTEPLVNLNYIYEDYEYVAHQQLDSNSYGTDVTGIEFYHSSSMGGNPYSMSDNVSTGLTNAFVSDAGTTQGSILIDFGRTSSRENTLDHNYLSNDQVGYYTAAKLADAGTDEYGNTYWKATTTSGIWVAVEFPNRVTISSFSVFGESTLSSGMVKDYNFYGVNVDPRFSGWNKKILLHSGTFLSSTDEQVVYLENTSSYLYYVLEIVSTYGGSAALSEWSLYRKLEDTGKKVISQLRLKPVADGINEYYFPKQIKLEASNDMRNWTTLLDITDTPTPFIDYAYGRWSRYTFDNYTGYYIYRLTCYDNWRASEDIIKMSEWEMVERLEESTVYRILGGTTDSINSVWADDNTTYDSGHFYVVNDVLNTIKVNELIEVITVSGTTSDINVKGS